jgi:hypothetical protein
VLLVLRLQMGIAGMCSCMIMDTVFLGMMILTAGENDDDSA